MKTLLYVQYTNPGGYPPLEHSAQILAARGWRVVFAGIRNAEGTRPMLAAHPGITVHELASCSAGWGQKIHYLRFCGWAAGLAMRYRPQWIYVSDALACPAGVLLCLLGKRVIYHEHDIPKTTNRSAPMNGILLARRWLARHAAICVAPNAARLEHLLQETGRSSAGTFAVMNCLSKAEVGPPRASPSGGLRVLYHGSIVPARLPLTVLEALQRLPETVTLDLAGYATIGSKDYIQQFQMRAAALGVGHRVRFVGTLQRVDLLKHARRCDVGLTLMPMTSSDVNMRTMLGASNKAFEYLACGLPVLVSDFPDWTAFYVKPGYGLACNPDFPETMADRLRFFLEHPQQTREMGEKGRQKILAGWNYESQWAPVLEQIEGNRR